MGAHPPTPQFSPGSRAGNAAAVQDSIQNTAQRRRFRKPPRMAAWLALEVPERAVSARFRKPPAGIAIRRRAGVCAVLRQPSGCAAGMTLHPRQWSAGFCRRAGVVWRRRGGGARG